MGGTLVDGFGGQPIRNSVILVEGERITAVGQVGVLAVPAGAEVISTEGMTVLPGLWDMHVHLMINGHSDYAPLGQDVSRPVRVGDHAGLGEAVADGGRHQRARSRRPARGEHRRSRSHQHRRDRRGDASTCPVRSFSTRRIRAPRLFRWGVTGADDARAKVKKLADAGVDVIKLIDQDQMTMDEVQAVVDEAHQRGLPVVAPLASPGGDSPRAGGRRGLLRAHRPRRARPSIPEDVIATIRERTAKMSLGPLFWTPTIEGLLNYEYLRDNPEALDDPAWHEGLPPDDRRRHPQVDRASGPPAVLPAHAGAPADARAEVQAAARSRRRRC